MNEERTSQATRGGPEDIFSRGRAHAPLTRVEGLSHITIERPDPHETRHFMLDFGLRRSAQDQHGDYYRGTSSKHHLVAARRGRAPRFVGLSLETSDRSSLETLTRVDGSQGPEETGEAGGGERVRLLSPSGFEVQVVHGIRPLDPLQTRPPLPTNRVRRRERVNSPQRTHRGPAQVERLAHVALQTPDIDREAGWFMQNFGLIASDFLVMAVRGRARPVATFLRVDAGRTPVDHHIIALFAGPRARLLYTGFEVLDFDDIATGGEQLYRAGARHVWGPGRHLVGSGLFDYWRDPSGDVFGHVTDGDLFNAEIVPRELPISRESLQQWGRPVPEDFFDAQTEVRGLREVSARIRADARSRRWLALGRALR